jgi:hypothetical protein
MSDVDTIDREASSAELARISAVIKAEPRFEYFATSVFYVKLLRLDQKLAEACR